MTGKEWSGFLAAEMKRLAVSYQKLAYEAGVAEHTLRHQVRLDRKPIPIIERAVRNALRHLGTHAGKNG